MVGVGCFLIESSLWLIDLWIFHFLCSKNSEQRVLRKAVKISGMIGLSILLITTDYLGEDTTVQLGIAVILLFLYYRMIFKDSMGVGCIYVVIYVLITLIGEGICIGLISIVGQEGVMEQLMQYEVMRYQVAIMSKIIMLFLTIIGGNYINIYNKSYSRSNLHLILMVLMISCVFLYGLILIKVEIDLGVIESTLNFFVLIASFGVLIVNLIVYSSINQLNEKIKKEKEHEFTQCQMEVLSQAIAENKVFEKEWRKVKHDYSNHLSCIDMLLQMENIPKARAYIQNLTQNWQEHSYSVHTGNAIVDAVVNQKLFKAKKEAILFKLEGEIAANLSIDDIDLCGLLSNSIDNAIEAASKLEEEHKRWIKVQLAMQETALLIEVKNAVKENIKSTQQLKTTKVNKKGHGIGMMSMQTTAHKYGGKVEWQCENNQFDLKILVPLE